MLPAWWMFKSHGYSWYSQTVVSSLGLGGTPECVPSSLRVCDTCFTGMWVLPLGCLHLVLWWGLHYGSLTSKMSQRLTSSSTNTYKSGKEQDQVITSVTSVLPTNCEPFILLGRPPMDSMAEQVFWMPCPNWLHLSSSKELITPEGSAHTARTNPK